MSFEELLSCRNPIPAPILIVGQGHAHYKGKNTGGAKALAKYPILMILLQEDSISCYPAPKKIRTSRYEHKLEVEISKNKMEISKNIAKQI